VSRIEVPDGTVVVYTDVMCGWSTVALHRFYRARHEAGLDDRLEVDLRLFLLEDVNQTPLTSSIIEPEKPVVGPLEPELDIKPWQGDLSAWPVTSLPTNEAVHAARAQSPAAAEQLDMALRLAFWRDSRCVSMRHEILAIADGCDAVDTDDLRAALDDGRARGPMMAQYLRDQDVVQGSPHFFLSDGSDQHNPGISFHQQGTTGAGFPVLDGDDPKAYDELVRRAA
jgi:predicted DsbA family dithiol-disulfide isomerase